jgi:hypothetical protein
VNTRTFASWIERRGRAPRRPLTLLSCLALAGALLFGPGPARAIPAGADAGAPPESVRLSLPPLPKFNDKSVPKPELADLQRLDRLVEGLVASDLARRQEARRQVASVDPSWLPAVVERFERVADTPNKLALKELLEQLRERSRAELLEARKAEGKSGPITAPDYLDLFIAQRDRSSPHLRTLTEVVAYSRMLENIGSLPAARRLVNLYVRFGEFLRVDTQLALARLGDRAVAALVEATGHPVPRIASWAERQLAELGKPKPSDALQLDDPALRADVLRAYGRLRRLDVVNLLVSYASSELGPVRSAAREALTLYGEAAVWPLREGYEKTVGARAPLAWSWQRVARELFARFDLQRRADVFRWLEQGLEAERNGDLTAACAAFDQALARDPLFEHGSSMVPAYLRCASERADSDARGALLAAARAERLEPTGPLHDRAASLRQTLEAEALLGRGLVDRALLERARALDPHNQRAAALLERLGSETRWNIGPWSRYLGAVAILALTGVGLGWMLLRQRRAA